MQERESRSHEYLLTAREVAEQLGLSEPAVRRLAAEGRLPSVRPLGLRALRFRATDIERIARGETVTPAQAPAAETERPAVACAAGGGR